MKIKRSRLKPCYHRQAIPKKDYEGNSHVEYGMPSTLDAEVWSAGGKLQTEMYGIRVRNIRNCRVNGKYEILAGKDGQECYRFAGWSVCEGDGICLNVPADREPDYKVIAIRPYRNLYMELEKV